MHHDICTVLDRTDQERRAECVVNHQRQTVLMRDLCYGVDIRNIRIRVAECFQIDCLRVLADCTLDFCEVVRIDEGRLDAVLRQCMCQQIVTAAVDRLLGDDMLACLCKRLNRIGDRGCTGCQCQRCDTALKRCDALLKDALCRVGQSAVDIACIRKTEACGCMCGILEYIGCGRVNRDGSCVRCGIRLLLTDVKL